MTRLTSIAAALVFASTAGLAVQMLAAAPAQALVADDAPVAPTPANAMPIERAPAPAPVGATAQPPAGTGVAVAAAAAALTPGEFHWQANGSVDGPVLIAVSLPDQKLYAYRNGALFAASTVSTGRRGHATPRGAFPILEKHREHYSNLYNSAPMPFMQRLTQDGIALHAGKLPGYPASHGCVRLPLAFAERLFAVTQRGGMVVVTDQPLADIAALGTPVDANTGRLLARPVTAQANALENRS